MIFLRTYILKQSESTQSASFLLVCNMELQSYKRTKILEILPATANASNESIPAYVYTDEDIQHLSIYHQLIIGQGEQYNQNRAYPDPLVPAPASISTNLGTNETKKRSRDISIEYAAKGCYELGSLLQLSQMILKSNRQCIQPYLCPARPEKLRQYMLPVNQQVHHIRSIFSNIHETLDNGILETNHVLTKQNESYKQLLILGKYWPLSTEISDANRTITSMRISKSVYRSDVSIDCSFVRLGDHPSALLEYLVPLLIVGDKISVHPVDNDRVLSTILITLNHSKHDQIASFNAFEYCSQYEMNVNISEEDAIYMETYKLMDIHNHCLKRKHDALCTRLFGKLRYSALELRDEWILKPKTNPMTDNTSAIESMVDNYEEHIMKELMDEVFYRECSILSIDRGSITIGISENLSYNISLVVISDQIKRDHSEAMKPQESSLWQGLRDAFQSIRKQFLESFTQSSSNYATDSTKSAEATKINETMKTGDDVPKNLSTYRPTYPKKSKLSKQPQRKSILVRDEPNDSIANPDTKPSIAEAKTVTRIPPRNHLFYRFLQSAQRRLLQSVCDEVIKNRLSVENISHIDTLDDEFVEYRIVMPSPGIDLKDCPMSRQFIRIHSTAIEIVSQQSNSIRNKLSKSFSCFQDVSSYLEQLK